jgi:hypothetical protein
VIDDQFVALFHVAQVLHRHRIGHAVPDGGLFFLQIGKAVNGGLGFEEVEHFFIPSAASDLRRQALKYQRNQSKSTCGFCAP